jgi:hypothetical protein
MDFDLGAGDILQFGSDPIQDDSVVTDGLGLDLVQQACLGMFHPHRGPALSLNASTAP